MDSLFRAHYLSPIGTIEIMASPTAIVSVLFIEEAPEPNVPNLPACLTDCLQQLAEYFAGERKVFALPLASTGTNFQEQVWHQLEKIDYGKTVSYYDLSVQLGNLSAIRAVGSANGKNKLLLIRPCHRVIGADGQPVGYAGGVWRKKWLLAHERKINGTHQLTLFG